MKYTNKQVLCDDLQAVSMSDKARMPVGLFNRKPKKRKSPYPSPSIVWITAAWHKPDKENHWPKGEFSNMMSDEHDQFHNVAGFSLICMQGTCIEKVSLIWKWLFPVFWSTFIVFGKSL